MEKKWLETSASFKAIIIGKLLGDGCITRQVGRKPRFQYIHAASDFHWSNYCYLMLRSDIPLNSPKHRKIMDLRLKSGYSLSHYTQSKTSPIICYLRDKWYPSDRKIIPFDLLNDYFNEESLAWWYMDDGHLSIKKRIPKKIILSCESFSKEENLFLIAFLQERYKLKFSIDKQNRIILYDQYQIIYFLNLINPYLHHSMYRKQIPYNLYRYSSPKKRTTIYLPLSIDIDKPTHEINHALSELTTIIKYYKAGKFYTKYSETIDKLQHQREQQGFQIVISQTNISNLEFLRRNTGLTYSQLACLCFDIRNKK